MVNIDSVMVNGVRYYDIDDTGCGISMCGKFIGKRNNPITTAYKNNNVMVNIDGKVMPVYKLILSVFHDKTDKDIGNYVLTFKDDDRSKVSFETVKPMTIEEHCAIDRPGIEYVKYDLKGNKYIFYRSGELYNIQLKKFLTVKAGPIPKYASGDTQVDIKNLLIDNFGDTDMRNHKGRYELVEGNGFDNIQIKSSAAKASRSGRKAKEDEPSVKIMDYTITKFRCKACELLFQATSVKQVVRLGKQCGPCTKHIHENEGIVKVVVKPLDIGNLKRHTCKRCYSTYVNKVEVCTKCDCLEVVR